MGRLFCSLHRFVKALNSYSLRFNCSFDVLNNEKKFNSLQKIDRRKFLYGFDEPHKSPKIANRILVTVVGNGAVGQPRCLCIFTDYNSYMFNCGEGSVRLKREHQTVLAKVRHVFITERTWENLAGLSDLYLSNQLAGVRRMILHGPPGIDDFKKISYSFAKDVRIVMRSTEDSPYENDTLKVEYVPIFKKSKHHGGHGELDPKQNFVFSYICEIKARQGQFLFEKCIEHGITSGQPLLDLKNGLDVTLPSGKQIKAIDVRELSEPAIIILVVDCSSEGMIDDFVDEKRFSDYQDLSEKSQDVYAVFHFSPSHVVLSYKYQTWMNKFHKNTKHVLLNTLNSTLSSQAIHRLQYILHELHPRMYPLLHEKPCTDTSQFFSCKSEIIQADPLLQFHFRPKIQIDRRNVPQLFPKEYVEEAKEGFGNYLATLKNVIKTQQKSSVMAKNDYPEIIFLGTCSSNSTAYRNVSVILVNINENCSILLDCGEGAYMQLLRYFGYDKIGSILKKITCIFLSHHHNDHYLGLFQLIKARKEAFLSSFELVTPLALLYTNPLKAFIVNFQRYFWPLGRDVKFFSNCKLTEDRVHGELIPFIGDDVKLFTVPVIHCYDSYGVVIAKEDWKIVYSGDAAPSQSLIDAGKDCSLLIHEASIEDNFGIEAATKNHSTPSQVVEVAEQMKAKCAILTHFSKRYLAVPVFPESEDQCVGCAFDNMSVRLDELSLLPLFIPCLKNMFSEQLEEFHDKSIPYVHFENVFIRTHAKMDVQN